MDKLLYDTLTGTEIKTYDILKQTYRGVTIHRTQLTFEEATEEIARLEGGDCWMVDRGSFKEIPCSST